ncbi:type II toxin-antitoxin system VapC family toxin [Pseudolabrys sp. FHR47]|uniref:type II toxin-antitoxin system VapC family toxin n=1 Tax=Pseudolabrys sp. FHR47 TaxID=2562284 RepID=UPI0010BEB081|nr:type II toxin-antitoxin system VapC family toxin [Pseudolabrys sp. FHR47]
MIAVDTSALMAVILREPLWKACVDALSAEDRILISAGTLVEAFIVSQRRNVGSEMVELSRSMKVQAIAITQSTAERISLIYSRWGRGNHPAALNFGDCFAYDVAKEHSCRLLYVGDDFALTDIESVL